MGEGFSEDDVRKLLYEWRSWAHRYNAAAPHFSGAQAVEHAAWAAALSMAATQLETLLPRSAE